MTKNSDLLKLFLANVEKVIIGKKEVTELVLISLLCKGHVLIEDIPGVGKTSLVSTVAKSLSCSFKRIQFTPDVLPSDVTGFSVFDPSTKEFNYREGPIMSQIILADEINRATPKTQSCLLEVMDECTVTVDGVTREVPKPFMVLATQNPIEYLGTHPLPEAQLDRFFMKLSMGYLNPDNEVEMLKRFKYSNPIEKLEPILHCEDIIRFQNDILDIKISDEIYKLIVDIANESRHNEYILLGASPRAILALQKAAQALAYLNGRDFVIPDDITYLLPFILSHRIVLKQEFKLKGYTTEMVIEKILEKVSVPF